jgi:hypothetical protein
MSSACIWYADFVAAAVYAGATLHVFTQGIQGVKKQVLATAKPAPTRTAGATTWKAQQLQFFIHV